jgi:hypothetical protein
MRHLLRRGLTGLAGVLVAVSAVAGTTVAADAAPAALPTPVTAGALPTPQTNGIVWSIALVGNIAVAGGRFTEARPAGAAPGTSEVPRNNLLAFDITTGALIDWAPDVTGTPFSSTTNPGPFCQADGSQWVCDSVFRIKASPDGQHVYVGGDFDKINGQWRSRVAEFDMPSGTLNPTFHPTVSSRVRGISVTSNAVYLGGNFTSVNGTARTRFAAVDPASGALLPWAPTADGEVFSVLADPATNKVLLGGNFNNVNGTAHRGMMEVDGTTGANAPWSVTLAGHVSVVTDIETDGSGVAYYGAYNYNDGAPRFEGRAAVNISTGAPLWSDGCEGDTQSIAIVNGIIYSASHTHECDTIGIPNRTPEQYQRLLAETTNAPVPAQASFNGINAGTPVPALLPFFANTNGGPSTSPWQNGPWAVAANSQYVIYGGEFTTVNGVAQQSLTRFAARGVAGAVNNGPQVPFRAPTATRNANGSITVGWTTTWDAQNLGLTYQVYRIGTSAPVYTTTANSAPWNLPALSWTDTAAPAGPQTYWIKAVDADGVGAGSPHGTSAS